MSKKNKPVQQQPISPERYIKERARKLPIDQCYLGRNLFEKGLGTALITRKMSNGKFVVGTYLIDVYCLGLKNTSYRFNVEDFELEELIGLIQDNEDDFVETDYVEIHNIIHGAIAYAEDLGFKPEKDWKISEYILEEDDDNVELIEYDFGKDGKPYYISGPFDNPEVILGTLRRNVGEGNFNFMASVRQFGSMFKDFGFDDEDDDDDEIYFEDYEVREVAEEVGFMDAELDNFYISLSNDIDEYSELDVLETTELNLLNSLDTQNKADEFIEMLKKLINKYPDNVNLREHLMLKLYIKHETGNGLKINSIWNNPDFELCKKAPTLFVKYLASLTSIQQWEEYEAVLEGKKHFKEIFGGCSVTNFETFVEFYEIRNAYYLTKNDVEEARKTFDFIDTIDETNEYISKLIGS